MTKPFWNHLIKIEKITLTLDRHGLTKKEKIEILTIIHQTIDNHILKTILTHLPQEKHQLFLDQFAAAPHQPDLLDFVKQEIADIEEKIDQLLQELEPQLLQEFE